MLDMCVLLKKHGLALVLLFGLLFCGCSSKIETTAENVENAISEKSCERYCECINCLKNRYLYCTSLGFSNSFVTVEPGENVYFDTVSEVFAGDFYFCVHDKNGEIVGEKAPLVSGDPAQRFTLKADEVCGIIRNVISGLYGKTVARQTIIQYGGSMNAGNAAELLAMENIDGGLIGGASLKADAFSVIVDAAQ